MKKAVIEIINPGIYSSIQDLGRRGYRRYGMPLSGAMDPYAYNVLNNILGNNPGSPAVEITGAWFFGVFLCDCTFALCGADPHAELEGKYIEPGSIYKGAEGSRLEFRKAYGGIRTYFSVGGGIDCTKKLGSASMIKGERLEKGVILESSMEKNIKTGGDFDSSYIQKNGKYIISVRKGPDFDILDQKQKRLFLKTRFRVSSAADRMGIRLEAKEGLSGDFGDMITKPLFPGCIQLTGKGIPIIIMNDGQTTGGYPVVAAVSGQDMRTAGQLKPGDWIDFKEMKDE